MLSESKKHVFITGITSGIGLGLARKFVEKGDLVCGCSLESAEEAAIKLPREVRYFQADVTDAGRMKEVISEFTIESGRLDVVVANAGINHEKNKFPDFKRGVKVFEVNVIGALNTFGPAASIMKEQGQGHLVGMSSISGVMGGLPRMAFYAASKAAVYSMCKTFEIDLKEFGIHVTTLAPGFIETPLTEGNTHKMPFKMSSDQAAAKIYEAIIKKRSLYMFPASLRVATQITGHLPDAIYKALMRSNPLKIENQEKIKD